CARGPARPRGRRRRPGRWWSGLPYLVEEERLGPLGGEADDVVGNDAEGAAEAENGALLGDHDSAEVGVGPDRVRPASLGDMLEEGEGVLALKEGGAVVRGDLERDGFAAGEVQVDVLHGRSFQQAGRLRNPANATGQDPARRFRAPCWWRRSADRILPAPSFGGMVRGTCPGTAEYDPRDRHATGAFPARTASPPRLEGEL